VAAVFGPVALAFFRNHHPGLRRFISELAERLFPAPLVKVEAPPTVDIALRRAAGGQLVLHLLNRTHFPVPDRYNFIDSVPPVGPVKVSLTLGRPPKNLAWLPGAQKLNWDWNKGSLRVTIPSVDIHGILVME
jgi:hypothetical protein